MGDPPGDVCLYLPGNPRAIITADCIKFRPDSELVFDMYIVYAIRSQPVRDQIKRITRGVAQQKMSLGRFAAIELPIAPIPEQRRVVLEMETQFTRLDAAEAALNQAHARLKRYRAAVLRAACEGRLVPTEAELARAEGCDYEPSDRLLERNLCERRSRWEAEQLSKTSSRINADLNDRWKSKYRDPVKPDVADNHRTPEGWAIASMDQMTSTITSGSRDWSRYYGGGSGTFLMAQNIRMGKLDLSHRQRVDPPEDDRDRVRSQVQPNDLLVTIVGANTGDICKVPRALSQHYVCQSVALMRPVLRELAEFLLLYMLHFPELSYN